MYDLDDNAPAIKVLYDEKRNAYWVKGDGFDFWLTFSSDEWGRYLECDCVRRYFQDGEFDSICFEVNGVPSVDFVEAATIKEMAQSTRLLDGGPLFG